MREARDEWGRWLAGLREWDLYFTLTYDPKRIHWPRKRWGVVEGKADVWRCRRDFFRWVKRSEEVLGRPVAAFAAVEAHKNGWPHMHGLADVGRVEFGDVALVGREWFDLAGGNRVKVVQGAEAPAAYCSKYSTKESPAGEMFFTRALVGRYGQRLLKP